MVCLSILGLQMCVWVYGFVPNIFDSVKMTQAVANRISNDYKLPAQWRNFVDMLFTAVHSFHFPKPTT